MYIVLHVFIRQDHLRTASSPYVSFVEDCHLRVANVHYVLEFYIPSGLDWACSGLAR
jgi:hypothetical protein